MQPEQFLAQKKVGEITGGVPSLLSTPLSEKRISLPRMSSFFTFIKVSMAKNSGGFQIQFSSSLDFTRPNASNLRDIPHMSVGQTRNPNHYIIIFLDLLNLKDSKGHLFGVLNSFQPFL